VGREVADVGDGRLLAVVALVGVPEVEHPHGTGGVLGGVVEIEHGPVVDRARSGRQYAGKLCLDEAGRAGHGVAP